eukprot:c33885_g1_i1.p1 GENE.c33885_g1_i1~~c33885_g1_i1.p1  ORF type:complete len:182 (-),score=69.45 c33885_g1_i1:5-550(-)
MRISFILYIIPKKVTADSLRDPKTLEEKIKEARQIGIHKSSTSGANEITFEALSGTNYVLWLLFEDLDSDVHLCDTFELSMSFVQVHSVKKLVSEEKCTANSVPSLPLKFPVQSGFNSDPESPQSSLYHFDSELEHVPMLLRENDAGIMRWSSSFEVTELTNMFIDISFDFSITSLDLRIN